MVIIIIIMIKKKKIDQVIFISIRNIDRLVGVGMAHPALPSILVGK